MYVPLLEGFFCVLYSGTSSLFNIEGGILRVIPESIRRCRNKMRVKITLVCTECKQRNYDTEKNKKNDPDRLELKKFCRFCRKHTLHKESK